MKQAVIATRMELLAVRKKKKLADKGYFLLKKKRDGLIKIFFEKIKSYYRLREEVLSELTEAYDTLHISQGVSGVNRLKSMAMSATENCRIEFTKENLMGVKVPKIELKRQDGSINASLLGTSYYVKKAHESFSALLPKIIMLSENKQVLYALAEEIKKVKRRVNALEHIQIPLLKENEKIISSQLSEVERENFVRLKHVKKQLEKNN